MNSNLLEVSGLHVSAGEKEILHGVDLTVGKDETHVLMGPNGTGKSTLGYAITGNPEYTVTAGKIVFDGEDITRLPVNERAKKGIFLSFQNPLEVPGVTLSAFYPQCARAEDRQAHPPLGLQKEACRDDAAAGDGRFLC